MQQGGADWGGSLGWLAARQRVLQLEHGRPRGGGAAGRPAPGLPDPAGADPVLHARLHARSSFRGRALRMPDNADMEAVTAKCEQFGGLGL